MEIFIRNIFGINNLGMPKNGDIAKRIEKQRNNYAHGNLNSNIDRIVALDLYILEWLNYALILKEIDIDSERSKEIINKLFDRNIDINI